MVSYLGINIITGIFLVVMIIGTQYANSIDCQTLELFENDRFGTLADKILYCEDNINMLNTISFIINILGLGVIITGVVLAFTKPKEKNKDPQV